MTTDPRQQRVDLRTVAGAWERHGVCGYDLSGERLWQDRSRTNVDTVTALADGRLGSSRRRRARSSARSAGC